MSGILSQRILIIYCNIDINIPFSKWGNRGSEKANDLPVEQNGENPSSGEKVLDSNPRFVMYQVSDLGYLISFGNVGIIIHALWGHCEDLKRQDV